MALGGLDKPFFDNYDLPCGRSYWEIIYSSDMVSLEYLGGVTQPVPEPSTLLLLGYGLLVTAGFLRRRFKKN